MEGTLDEAKLLLAGVVGTEAAVVPPKGGGENRPKPGDWTGVGCEVNPEKLAGVEGTEEALGLAKAGGDPKVKEEEEEVGVADAVVVVAFLEQIGRAHV